MPVGPSLTWMDTQGARHSQRVVGGRVQGYNARALATWVRHAGGVPSTSGADPVGHILHLERDRPDVAKAARWYLEPVDYLSMRLTGRAAATHMSMTAAWLTDNRRLDLLGYDPALVALAGVDASKLPPLVPSGGLLGPVAGAAAAELGIPETAQVVTGMPDLHSAAVGSGCVREHEAHLAIGTSAWISCPVASKRTDVIRQMASVPGLGDGRYLLGNNQDSAGRCLQWFRDSVATAPGAEPPPYERLTGLAATAGPGSGGVVFTPWLTGERSPVDDRFARAGFHNLSVGTTQAHLARAVLEGVAYNLRWLLGAAEHFTRRRLDPLRIIGGGAQSDLWCQVVADVCDRTLERVEQPLLAGLRAAGLAASLALGEIGYDEVRALVPVDREFCPDPGNRTTYDRLFREFPRLHRVQHAMFTRLNR
jgi:xylulokinase